MERLVLLFALLIPVSLIGFGMPNVLPMLNVEEPRPLAKAVPTEAPLLLSGPTWAEGRKVSPLQVQPPPTLAPYDYVPPRPTPAPGEEPAEPTPAASPTPVAERAVIFNTGGIGAAVRAQPGVSNQVAGLREGVSVDVLERQSVNGREWVRIRTPQGVEGWVLGIVARTQSPAEQAATGQRATPAAVPTASRPAAAPTVAPAQPRTNPAPTPIAPSAGSRTHQVRPGDELRYIAAANGVSMADILAINNVANPDSLTVGQVLRIPEPRR